MDEFRKAHGSCQVYEMSKSINLSNLLAEQDESQDILTLSAGSLTLLKSISSSRKTKFYIQEISSVRIARFILLLEIIIQEMDISLQGRLLRWPARTTQSCIQHDSNYTPLNRSNL